MSALVEHSALAALMDRAGASDQDREAWLAERRTGVTATEIRDLYTGGPTFWRELIEKKLGIREEPFVVNQYTAWGKKREPIIAAWAEKRFAIADEHRIFHAEDNARFLASPDGLGVNWDGVLLVSEIKTSKHDIVPWTSKFESVGYLIQMLWSMRVTGARRSLYVWERHNDIWEDRGGEFFEPIPMQPEPLWAWVEYDEPLVAKLEAMAVAFLADLDAARVALEAGEGPVVDEELDTLAVNLLRFREMESEGKKAKEREWAALQSALAARGGDFSQESALARITYTAATAGTTDEVDQEAAIDSSAAARKQWESLLRARASLAKKEAAWSEFAAGFTRSAPSTKKPGLTVTSVKTKEMKK